MRRLPGRRLPGLTAGLLALGLCGLGPGAGAPAPPRLGVEMPAAGDDGAAGLAAAMAVRLAWPPGRVDVQDSAHGGFQNPHRDEGSENGVDVRAAPAIVAAFARDAGVVAAVGGLRRNVGDADAAAAEAHAFPLVLLARWSRGGPAVCLCAAQPRLVAFAREQARRRFGPRLLVVLLGEAGRLPALWPGGFAGVTTANAGDASESIAAARRRSAGADAVLVIADERPPTVWRGAAFRRGFTAEFARRLGHRDFRAAPENVPRGGVLVLRAALPDGAARRGFARRFHAAAGFVPGTEATLAYAAGQVLRAAGSDRAAVRTALARRRFETVAGPVSFDRDGYWSSVPLAATAP